MGYRKEKFANGEIYHIVIRAIDDNLIFEDKDDYYRGIFSIFEFNNSKPIEIRLQREKRRTIKKHGGPSSDNRDHFVDILTFCFMPNHIHLLVRQLKDNGISKFMKKVGTGYGGYFNKKHNRKGHVFQNRFRAVHIKNEEQLKIVWAYINANSVSLIEPKWKEKGIRNFNKVIESLGNYKWSGYSDYIGQANFPSVTDRKLISDIIGGEGKCKEFLSDYIKYKGRVRDNQDLLLE